MVAERPDCETDRSMSRRVGNWARTKIRKVVHVHGKNNKNSSVLNSIFLAGGDNSGGDLGHYCAKIITLGLRMLSSRGGLPGCVPVITYEGRVSGPGVSGGGCEGMEMPLTGINSQFCDTQGLTSAQSTT